MLCTSADVLQIARVYNPDVTDNVLAASRIDECIAEAEVFALAALSPRYEIAVIRANVPFAVNRFTALKAAWFLLTRYQTLNMDAKALEALNTDMKTYNTFMQGGAIYDSLDNEVPRDNFASFAERVTPVDTVYENGPRHY